MKEQKQNDSAFARCHETPHGTSYVPPTDSNGANDARASILYVSGMSGDILTVLEMTYFHTDSPLKLPELYTILYL